MIRTQVLPAVERQRYVSAYLKSFGLHLSIVFLILLSLVLNVKKPLSVTPIKYIDVELTVRPKPSVSKSPKAATKKTAPPKKPKKIKPKPEPKAKPKPKKLPVAKKPKVSQPKPKAKPKPKSRPKVKPPVFDASYLEEALNQEATERALAQEQAEQLAVEEKAAIGEIQRYKWLIKQRVEQFFLLPPSAKKGMFVLLEIQLFPDGQVREVMLLESSGDDSLDRFAIRAVQEAGSFEVPVDVKLFQRYFRRFNFKFQPE